jgi:hypothetical protein
MDRLSAGAVRENSLQESGRGVPVQSLSLKIGGQQGILYDLVGAHVTDR